MQINNQKVLLIGSGGREHAVGWKLKQSEKNPVLYFAPGNTGTAEIGVNVDIKATDIPALLAFAQKEKIDLTLALPDDPLALGIVDEFQKVGLKIWGPTKAAAQLEWSKAFAKDFMKRHNIPTARYETFTDYEKAVAYIGNEKYPVVIKADGLALGKGVTIAQTKEEAIEALQKVMVEKIFGDSGNTVVIEEYLSGPEISFHALSDGVSCQVFPSSQDHKRIGEGDAGSNTGGMGTIAPLPFVDKALFNQIKNTIILPTLVGMEHDGHPFAGILYPGIMLTEDGPKVFEFNSRFGDPETQTYMRLLKTDLLEIFNMCIEQKLSEIKIDWEEFSACNIALASGGYPGNYEKGKVISGVKDAEQDKDIVVFHAGTKLQDGGLVTNGGRVLGVSATGATLEEALAKAYKAIEKISFDGMQYRKDIGKKALALLS
jgi:phosphoribosylamine--glycine ligase